MDPKEEVAKQIGLLTIANIEQAVLIQKLQFQLSNQQIPGYESDQEGQGLPHTIS